MTQTLHQGVNPSPSLARDQSDPYGEPCEQSVPVLSDFLMLGGLILISLRPGFALCWGCPQRTLLLRPAGRGGGFTRDTLTMNDLIFISLTVAFFVIAAWYALFCEKVR